MICGMGINDMPRGWTESSELNYRIYKLWGAMIRRCYSEKVHDKQPNYKICFVCDKWLKLSGFVEEISKIPNYNKWVEGFSKKRNPYELDKDIKSNGKNKCYCLENCMFVLNKYNTIQSASTRNYNDKSFRNKLSVRQKDRFKDKENHPFYNKHHSEETKEKIGKANATKVIRYDLNGNFIDIWMSQEYASETLGICKTTISKCCRKEYGYLTAGGYMWEFYTEDYKIKINPYNPITNKRKIVQYDKKGNLIKVWESIKQASEFYKVSRTCIKDCCTGRQKSCKGFVWKYYEEKND